MPYNPPALKPGDTIGVMSMSSWLDEADITKAKAFMEERGYNVMVHPQATARLGQSAGSAQEKVDAFHELIANPDVKMIMSARGGNRAITMLDKIDFDLVKNNPKILIGYSDLTLILNAVHKICGITTCHGPLFRELPAHKNFDDMIAMLSGKKTLFDLPGRTLGKGEAQGVLVGGNLSVFQTLIGTPYLPDMKGAILFLEDVSDEISRYDRMFGHLRVSGALNQISGLIVGQFTNVKDNDKNPFGFTLEDVIREHTDGLDIPVLMDAPFGHGADLPTFPIGAPVTLKVGETSATLTLS